MNRFDMMLSRLADYVRRAADIGFGTLLVKSLYDIRTDTRRISIGPPGILVQNYFKKIRAIPGAFNLDDMNDFYIVLTLQTQYGLHGDLLEIGTYHGRSAALLSVALAPGEHLHLCDAFERATEDTYTAKPTKEVLVDNIRRVNPDVDLNAIVVHDMLSSDLNLTEGQVFRFIHIDGGHSEDQTYFDIELVKDRLIPGGVICVDDYGHSAWPGVKAAVDRFLRDNVSFQILFDLNRHGALGRKVYLTRR
jgi:hypothetical protein